MPDKKIGIETRFHQKYIPVTNCGCWIWTDAPDKYGYGRLQIGGKAVKAHRISYEIHKGDLDKNKLVCHTCDMPICVNPDHLYLGTNQDNMDDMVRRNRSVPAYNPHPGELNGRAVLTHDDVVDILYKYYYLGENSGKLSEKYPVTTSGIQSILRGKTWKHVDRVWIDPTVKANARSVANKNRKKPTPHIRITKKGPIQINSKNK